MHDLAGITLLTFVRLDNEERVLNLKAMVGFYRSQCENYSHIIVEDDTKPKVPSVLDFHQDDVYVFTRSITEWKKSEGYNKGIKLSKTNLIVLNDVDAILKPTQLLDTANILNNDSNAALVYPYNGLFLCATDEMKRNFMVSYDYSALDSRFPETLVDYNGNTGDADGQAYYEHVNKTYNEVLVGHIASKGGCVMGRRDNLIRCNGYNPNFKGWGYEDDEMPARANILGYGVGRLPGKRSPLWHLPHFDGTGSPKETQEFYEHNRQECSKVENMNRKDLSEYTKTWRL